MPTVIIVPQAEFRRLELMDKFYNGTIVNAGLNALVHLSNSKIIELESHIVTANDQIDEWTKGYHAMVDAMKDPKAIQCSQDCGDCNENRSCA